jgi:inosose dehydratase
MKSRFARAHSSRREFIRRTTTTTLGLAAAPSLVNAVLAAGTESLTKEPGLVGSNVYGWTQYYQREKKPFDAGEVMSALRDAGYDYLETFLDAGQPDNNARLAEQMKAKGLKPVTLYTGARLHEPDQAKDVIKNLLAAAKVCYEAGFRCWSCNLDPIGREKTDGELKNQVAALKDLCAGLKEIGLRLGVHHHLPEIANKAREFHYVFRNTDPAQVGFCYDVHWVFRGGIKPMEALKEYGDRVVSWHLRQSRNGIWWEDLDTGDVDYAEVANYAQTHKLPRRFTVELALENGTQITRSAVENHRRCREFVRNVFGA